MRLWSVHPAYLDAKGLVACWREALLAQKVLEGKTRGYVHHPQLERFRAASDPAGAIALFLQSLAEESTRRGYRFDRTRIHALPTADLIPVTLGQISYETALLRSKIASRDSAWLETPSWRAIADARYAAAAVKINDSFQAVPGSIESWERSKDILWPI